MIELNTEAVRAMVERHALAIDPEAKLEVWPEALAFQVAMARAVILETVKHCAIACDHVPIRYGNDGICRAEVKSKIDGLVPNACSTAKTRDNTISE